MTGRHFRKVLLLVLLAGIVSALTPEVAWAGPGGIIKSAAYSPLGRIVIGILTLIFLPVILYYSARGAINVHRTRRDLARLATLYPQYRWLDLKVRVTETFHWVWSAWTRQKMDLASDYTTHWYWQNQQLRLEEWAERGLENVCHLKGITGITPLFVQHVEANDGEGSRVVLGIKARVVDYLVERSSGRVVQGDKKEGELETIWTFKRADGAWRLDLIEDSVQEWAYLLTPNEVPASVASVPQRA